MALENKVKPIIGRVGGKVRLAPWIIEHLTRFQWSIYCEPFAGSAAVYFRLIQEGIFEQIRERGHHPRITLNDADSRITQLFRTCRDHPELLAYAVAMTPYSREEHRLAQQGIEGIEDEIEQARKTLVDGWQSFKYMPGDSWGTQRYPDHDQFKENLGNWQTLPQRILAASPHLQGGDIRHEALLMAQALIELATADGAEGDIAREIEQARRYLVDSYQSFGLKQGDSWRVDKESVRGCDGGKNTRDNTQIWHTLPQRILAASPHLQGDPNPIDSRHILNDAGRSFVEPSVDVHVEMARRYLVMDWQGNRDRQKDGNFVNWLMAKDERVKNFDTWRTIPTRILTATEHLKKCYIENDDAVKCIERWATPHTAIYADPPYVDCEDYYAHNAKAGKAENLEMHHRLAEALNTVEAAAVVVSYYPNDLLDTLYPEADWERHYKDTVASSAGITRQSKTRTRPKRTELLLVRKQRGTALTKANLSGQLGLF